MTLYRKSALPDGSEVVGDNLDPAYEVILPAGKLNELSWDRAKVDAWLERNREDAAPELSHADERTESADHDGLVNPGA